MDTAPPSQAHKSASVKKHRMAWSQDHHRIFDEAVNQIGFHKATPKKIFKLMKNKVEGLTIQNVSSHLQKYRAKVKLKHNGGIMNQPDSQNGVDRSSPVTNQNCVVEVGVLQGGGDHSTTLILPQNTRNGGAVVPSHPQEWCPQLPQLSQNPSSSINNHLYYNNRSYVAPTQFTNSMFPIPPKIRQTFEPGKQNLQNNVEFEMEDTDALISVPQQHFETFDQVWQSLHKNLGSSFVNKTYGVRTRTKTFTSLPHQNIHSSSYENSNDMIFPTQQGPLTHSTKWNRIYTTIWSLS